jgi:hypothetical protein
VMLPRLPAGPPRRCAAQSPGVHASEAQSLCGSCPHLPGLVSYKRAPSVPGCGRQGTNVRRHRCRRSVRVRHTCVPATCLTHATLGGGAGEKTQACVSLCHAALPMLTRARSECVRARASKERAKALFGFKKGPLQTPSKRSCCLSIIELACAFRLAGRPGRHVVCEYAQTRVEAAARLARRHTFASEGRIIPQASSP